MARERTRKKHRSEKIGLTLTDLLVIGAAILLPTVVLQTLANAEHTVYAVIDPARGENASPLLESGRLAPRYLIEAARGLHRRYPALDAALLRNTISASSMSSGRVMISRSTRDASEDRDVIAAVVEAVFRERGVEPSEMIVPVQELRSQPFGNQASSVVICSIATGGLCILLVFGRLWYLRRKGARRD